MNFYPRPPRGGRRSANFRMTVQCLFLSTPSARRATPPPLLSRYSGPISIHALREEGDVSRSFRGGRNRDFYPRPPRGGRLSVIVYPSVSIPISIHALREEGDAFVSRRRVKRKIFLSTPSARRATSLAVIIVSSIFKFLSTPSARRATRRDIPAAIHAYISIHALREEGDAARLPRLAHSRYFYPRPPRGGRRSTTRAKRSGGYFYPRPPRGGRQD